MPTPACTLPTTPAHSGCLAEALARHFPPTPRRLGNRRRLYPSPSSCGERINTAYHFFVLQNCSEKKANPSVGEHNFLLGTYACPRPIKSPPAVAGSSLPEGGRRLNVNTTKCLMSIQTVSLALWFNRHLLNTNEVPYCAGDNRAKHSLCPQGAYSLMRDKYNKQFSNSDSY